MVNLPPSLRKTVFSKRSEMAVRNAHQNGYADMLWPVFCSTQVDFYTTPVNPRSYSFPRDRYAVWVSGSAKSYRMSGVALLPHSKRRDKYRSPAGGRVEIYCQCETIQRSVGMMRAY